MKFKKIAAILLAVTLVLSVFACNLSLFSTANSTAREFFVTANGDDATADGTEAKPFKTVKKAQEAAVAAGDTEAIFYIKGEVEFEGGVEHTALHTIKGFTSDCSIKIVNVVTDGATGKFAKLCGPTNFENLGISPGSKSGYILTNGYPVELTKCQINAAEGNTQIYVGNYDANADKRQKFTINTWNNPSNYLDPYVAAFGTEANKTHPGIDYVVNGGGIIYFNLGKNGTTTFTGDVNIIWNGDSADTKYELWTAGTPVLQGALQVVFNNGGGTKITKDSFANLTPEGGKWYIFGEKKDGSSITTTDTAGTFKVEGELTAVATDQGNAQNVYYSDVNGFLTVPAGKYNVTYTNERPKMNVTYYVDEAGDDATGDGSEAKPFKTVKKAQEAATALESTAIVTAYIIVKGEVDFEGGVAHTGIHNIKGADDTAKLKLINTYLNDTINNQVVLQGPTNFEDIDIPAGSNNSFILTNGFEVTVTNCKTSSNVTQILVGNYDKNADTHQKFTINGWNNPSKYIDPYIAAFGPNAKDNTSAGVDFYIGGGIKCLNLGRNKINSTYTGDVNVIWNGADTDTEYKTYLAGTNTLKGALQMVFNFGRGSKLAQDKFATLNPEKGKWYMYSEAFEDAYLDVTETAGTFSVPLEYLATAVNRDNPEESYKSNAKGLLTVPAGTYDVTFDIRANVRRDVYYVSSEGDDALGDGSEEAPFKTIKRAQAIAASFETAGPVDTTIMVIGQVSFGGEIAHTGVHTIKGVDGDSKLEFENRYINGTISNQVLLYGPTIFDSVGIPTGASSSFILTNGFDVEFNRCFSASSSTQVLIGNFDQDPNKRQKFTINTWVGTNKYLDPYIAAFGPDSNNSIAGVDLTINGGGIKYLNIGRSKITTTFNGDVNVVWNGVDNDPNYQTYLAGTNYLHGALQMVFNNGCGTKLVKDAFEKLNAEGGKWYMFGAKGAQLTTTTTAGTFKVTDGYVARAINRADGKLTLSKNGELKVPAGYYDVEFLAEGDHVLRIENTDKKVVFAGQNVKLEKGKTYKFSFDFDNVIEGIGSNVEPVVYSKHGSAEQTVVTAMTLASESGYHKEYTFTLAGETDDYGVGFKVNGKTTLKILNPQLFDGTNNILVNSSLETSLNGWNLNAKLGTEKIITISDETATISVGNYTSFVFETPVAGTNLLKVSYEGAGTTVGTNVALKNGSTYKVKLAYRAELTDFFDVADIIVRDAYGSGKNAVHFSTALTGNKSIKSTYNDFDYYVSEYTFTSNLPDGEYAIAIQLNKKGVAYIYDLSVYDNDAPTANLVANPDFTNGLTGWYTDDAQSLSGNSFEFADNKISYTIGLQVYEKLFFNKNHNIMPFSMLYIENNFSYQQLFQRFDNVLKAGHTYIYKISICAKSVPNAWVSQSGERTKIIDVAPVDTVKDGNVYTATYELKLPDTIDSEIYVGFQLSGGTTAYVFDPVLYDNADAEKTNLFSNSDFRNGLNDWIYGWQCNFKPGYQGYGLIEYTTESGNYIRVYPYDVKHFISYDTDEFVNDGMWWNPDDVYNEDAPITGFGDIEGVLIDNNKKPLQGITVKLVGENGSEIKTLTNVRGQFSFKNIPNGIYELFLVSANGETVNTDYYPNVEIGATLNISIVAEPEITTVYTQTTMAKSVIKGTLYDAKRNTLEGITVHLNNGQSIVTDENGEFSFEELEAGEYELYAVNQNGTDFHLKTVTLDEGQIVSLRLKYDNEDSKAQNPVQNDTQSGSNVWIWIIIVLAILVCAAAVVVIIFALKKKKN